MVMTPDAAETALQVAEEAFHVRWDMQSDTCFSCRKDASHRKLLLCDTCPLGYHLACVIPQLSAVPEGDWVCNRCVPSTSHIREMTARAAEARFPGPATLSQAAALIIPLTVPVVLAPQVEHQVVPAARAQSTPHAAKELELRAAAAETRLKSGSFYGVLAPPSQPDSDAIVVPLRPTVPVATPSTDSLRRAAYYARPALVVPDPPSQPTTRREPEGSI